MNRKSTPEIPTLGSNKNVTKCPHEHANCVATEDSNYIIYCRTCNIFYQLDKHGRPTWFYKQPEARESLGDFGF